MDSAASRLLFVVLVACKHDAAPPADPEISGSFTIDDAPMRLTECHPSAGPEGIAVQLTTETGGRLRFRKAEMAFQFQSEAWEVLACDKLERSWGGGARVDGSAYWRGTLDFRCAWGHLMLAGKLALDCGKITPDERRSLDKNRAESLKEPAPIAP